MHTYIHAYNLQFHIAQNGIRSYLSAIQVNSHTPSVIQPYYRNSHTDTLQPANSHTHSQDPSTAIHTASSHTAIAIHTVNIHIQPYIHPPQLPYTHTHTPHHGPFPSRIPYALSTPTKPPRAIYLQPTKTTLSTPTTSPRALTIPPNPPWNNPPLPLLYPPNTHLTLPSPSIQPSPPPSSPSIPLIFRIDCGETNHRTSQSTSGSPSLQVGPTHPLGASGTCLPGLPPPPIPSPLSPHPDTPPGRRKKKFRWVRG